MTPQFVSGNSRLYYCTLVLFSQHQIELKYPRQQSQCQKVHPKILPGSPQNRSAEAQARVSRKLSWPYEDETRPAPAAVGKSTSTDVLTLIRFQTLSRAPCPGRSRSDDTPLSYSWLPTNIMRQRTTFRELEFSDPRSHLCCTPRCAILPRIR